MVTTDDLDKVKSKYGVPTNLSTCHTGLIGKYFLEGHIPAQDIRRLMKEKPDIKGLAVPGMPGGSPGMESSTPEPYQVISVGQDGRYTVFARH